jgi:hypothetical protein
MRRVLHTSQTCFGVVVNAKDSITGQQLIVNPNLLV